MSIFIHAKACLTDRNTIIISGKIIFIREVSSMSGIRVNEGSDTLFFCSIYKSDKHLVRNPAEVFHFVLRPVSFHGKEGRQERRISCLEARSQRGKAGR